MRNCRARTMRSVRARRSVCVIGVTVVLCKYRVCSVTQKHHLTPSYVVLHNAVGRGLPRVLNVFVPPPPPPFAPSLLPQRPIGTQMWDVRGISNWFQGRNGPLISFGSLHVRARTKSKSN